MNTKKYDSTRWNRLFDTRVKEERFYTNRSLAWGGPDRLAL